jgi:hypothetical protein
MTLAERPRAEFRSDLTLSRQIQTPAQADDLGLVHVVPGNTGRRIDPEHPTVQPAAGMHDRGVGIVEQELPGPLVENVGPQCHADHFVTADLELREFVGCRLRSVSLSPVTPIFLSVIAGSHQLATRSSPRLRKTIR